MLISYKWGGPAIGNPSMAAYGYIFRDSRATFLICFARNIVGGTYFCWNKMCLTLPLESFDDNKVLKIVNWIS